MRARTGGMALAAEVRSSPTCSASSENGMARSDIVIGRIDFQYWVRGPNPLGVKQRSFVFSGTMVT